MAQRINVYLECGKKRTFACAVDWPGWCCEGADQDEALAGLLAYGPKYASILARTRLGFVAPKRIVDLVVVERLPGTATTDFGAIGVPPAADRDRSCDAALIARFEKVLSASWRAFDAIVECARGKPLAKGPRGGGRSLEAIVDHVIGADAAYLGAVGWKAPKAASPGEQMSATRDAILEAIKASAAGMIPERGPRGGVRWTARYFTRRVAWHVIWHIWEIERRLAPGWG